MIKQIAEKLARRKFSWDMMVGNGQGCLILMFQIFLWIPVTYSALTGAMLVIYGGWWMLHGIYPLFIENRPTSVSISSGVIIAAGCSIIGLGIAMVIPVMTEVDWVPRMAGIFYNLAFFLWLFVIMKVAPVITRSLLIGAVFCVIAGGYALVCNALMVINAIVSDIPRVAADSEQMIGYMVSGGAIVGWTLLVMRKTAPTNFKILVPVFTICGIIYIGFGIVMTMALIFR